MKTKTNKIFKSFCRILTPIFIMISCFYLYIARPIPVFSNFEKVSVSVVPDDLKKHVIYLSETKAPRDVNHSENLKNVSKYIENELKKYSKEVSLQKYNYGKDEYHNVIAKFGNLESDDIIVIGAHYDAFSDLPRADDNASGVAGLIEISKLLSKTKFKKQIQIVAFTLEEPPFFATKYMGSYVHAESLKNENVELMISLEMIGYFSDKENTQKYPLKALSLFYPTKGNYIAVVDRLEDNNAVGLKTAINKYTELPAYSINAPLILPSVTFSDHKNYWHFGFPAIMVTDTAFMRNQEYHTKFDTYDRLNYDAMSKVVIGLYMYINEIGNK